MQQNRGGKVWTQWITFCCFPMTPSTCLTQLCHYLGLGKSSCWRTSGLPIIIAQVKVTNSRLQSVKNAMFPSTEREYTKSKNKRFSTHVSGSYDKQRDFELLGQEMASHEKGPSNRLFYLALPPSVFKPVTTMLKVNTITRLLSPLSSKQSKQKWDGWLLLGQQQPIPILKQLVEKLTLMALI